MNEICNGLKLLFARKIPDVLLFNSGTFWTLFILFITVYSLIYRRKTQMMLYVATFSLGFYFLTNGFYFLILPFTALCDFFLAKKIYNTDNQRKKTFFLSISIVLSLGILFYFKYTNFFIKSWNEIFSGNFNPVDIFLPVGISFYTFQTISYVTDVYKQRVKPADSFLQYLFYLSFFPLILAGPIMRAKNFFPQIKNNKTISRSMIYGGLWLIILGLIKKAIFADYIAQYNNWVFDAPLTYSGFECLVAVLGYTAQIYCDFSGYSDMSIGMAAVMGFDLGKNFNLPYQAQNLSDFWRRWHISLSTWFRDYVYIPLGGNRKGTCRTYLNNLITMLIAGLWHGASYMFIIWGGMHGVGLIVHKMQKKWLDRIPDRWYFNIFWRLLTFSFVAFLWIFFRAANLTVCKDMISNTICHFDFAYFMPFLQVRPTYCVFLLLIFLLHSVKQPFWDRMQAIFIRSSIIVKILLFTIVIQLIIQFGSDEVQPFIYFQF
ncbi:MAG: MBOAT family protein [Candidatus Symbiothrix sp.]|nr:MBOAT family protein [Candidatus Symbiothrix sp.]